MLGHGMTNDRVALNFCHWSFLIGQIHALPGDWSHLQRHHS
jgi:hypothetical protein